ncbi:unnamed protein product [Clonostachys rosea f. rosea IK726]|uniref:Uncharacterized protein n=1 Tax=Clonostachys rosea f. rosea IK726 TaxID=1349383 RepID=A0ACA9T8K3_BIOOC|nr:unnamed protein product [Clonostachys rosea f. rosea IK726]
MAGIIVAEEWDSPIVMNEPACPERDVIMRMINDDGFTVDHAINEICSLTTAASTEDFQANTPSATGDTHLYRHAERVMLILRNLAAVVPHARQSKLIEFILHLEKCTIPDPNRGGIVGAGKDTFWTDVPPFSENLVRIMGKGFNPNANGVFGPAEENRAAFLAQLFEKRYEACQTIPDWTLSFTSAVFATDMFLPDKGNIRMFCIWLIYANRKLWLDTHGLNWLAARPEWWEGWRVLLLDCQSNNEAWCSDEDTQMLMRRALDCMHITEDEH